MRSNSEIVIRMPTKNRFLLILTGLVVLLLAFLKMGLQSVKAGMVNPVETLRNE